MSHNIEHRTYPIDVDKAKVKASLDNYVSQVDWEEGCSGLAKGIRWLDGKVYDSYEEAIEATQKLDRGWYDNLAVLYNEYPRINPAIDKTAMKFQQDCDKILKDKLDYEAAHSPKNFKAEFIGCKNCGSKISKAHLKGPRCPVCGEDLRSESTLKALARFEERIKEKRKQYQERLKFLMKKGKPTVKWLVKFEYHT